jgi:putative membrane protein
MMGFNTFNWCGLGQFGSPHGFGLMGMAGGGIMFMLLLIVLIVVAIVWFSKNGNHHTPSFTDQPTTDRSLEILNERYALGEIDDDEYSKKKMELRKLH